MSPNFLFIKERSKYAYDSGWLEHCSVNSGTGNKVTLTVFSMNVVFQT